ncbi:hypothetical protein RJ641_011575 [Dillenia turbinata]|uniref:Protein SKIP34 n=1 Tax=Dillenia turbinata TaxID=194707 RepID=A0AAN8V436_9MAGN
MCYNHLELFSGDEFRSPRRRNQTQTENAEAVEDLRVRLADTEARLQRARAREAELSRRLEEMKRFVSVMEILESYLKRRFLEQRDLVERLLSPPCLLLLSIISSTRVLVVKQNDTSVIAVSSSWILFETRITCFSSILTTTPNSLHGNAVLLAPNLML